MIRFKLFAPWNDNAKVKWLGEMSRNGYHISGWFLGFNSFTQGMPHNYVYRMEYQPPFNDKDPEYYQMLKDAGWEHIQVASRWQYYRKESENGENEQIFTDTASRIQGYKSMLPMLYVALGIEWGVFVWVSVFAYGFLAIHMETHLAFQPAILSGVLLAALLSILTWIIFLLVVIVKLKRRIKQLMVS